MEVKTHSKMIWNPWTDKSRHIPFKSSTIGVGDGEDKVAFELDTHVLGQNSPYDMKPIINGVPTKCDVKKLDTKNDFNTGVNGRNALRIIKINIMMLLESIRILSDSDIFTPEERPLLQFFIDKKVSPDEVAVGTLKKLKQICEILHTKMTNILKSLPVIQPFTDADGPVSMTLDTYYIVCERIGRPFPAEYASYESVLQILRQMDNRYIQHPHLITDDLNNLVNFLEDIMLIIVDEKKGYMLVSDITKIRFLRITRGNPRFQIIF